ncbi:hypothetical protein [Halodesulfovibrio sp.]|jgi:hypothetical protein|uniref:hypothetical protein n=1 Tax=Halodesulfovibrio sp. TaxID=1912772 RepID=UPI0025F8EC5D|nr:hypothetical protein [Halodesulfovibrio sp.]MCT4536276.1 hypothetical protein [Halodesulfovibrio sp.]MCT4626920.1 hypothetical protein [Halodesulfovibrio sp.]
MYPWQIIYFVAVVALAAFVLLRSPQGTVGKIMTFMLNWLAPYTSITIAFVAIFQQGFLPALPFFALAGFCFVTFLRRSINTEVK